LPPATLLIYIPIVPVHVQLRTHMTGLGYYLRHCFKPNHPRMVLFVL
jgi:hypothetical protein